MPIQRSGGMEELWSQEETRTLLQRYPRKINNQLALASTTVVRLEGAGGSMDAGGISGSQRGATASVVIEGKLYALFGSLEPETATPQGRRYA
eukprot:1193510-Prorocentrum_minimum.AAC.4